MTFVRLAAGEVLEQGQVLLQALTAGQYTRPLPEFFQASIGGHYRHALEHFVCLAEGEATGEVDYDTRRRDTTLETDLATAAARTRLLHDELDAWSDNRLERPVRVRTNLSLAAETIPLVPSTLAREVLFCTAHAIHHYALIRVMAATQGVELPAHFGVAPSTLLHQRGRNGG